MSEQETLEDHLRRSTRNFTARLPEDRVLALGRDLARELQKAHGETPPRFPELEPALVPMADGRPVLSGSRADGDVPEDLFRLGGLLCWLASGVRPDVSWRLDGPPPLPLSTLGRRAALATLAAPRRADRFPTAAEAAEALASALEETADRPSSWPLFRGDSARRGAAAASEPRATGLAALWDARVGAVHASPALTGSLVVAATTEGRLVFVDRRSGRVLHELKVGSAIESSPSLADGLAHVGTDDGELVAVSVAQGEERWRIKLGQLVRSSPLPVGQRVLVGVVESKTTGSVVALDAAKGKAAWVRKMAAVFSSPTLAGAAVLVGGDDGALHALDVEKGTLLWSRDLGGKVRATAAASGEVAVVGSFEGRLASVRVADGSVAWTAEVGHSIYSSPCLVEGLCVFGCHEGHVHGFEVASGRPAFEAQTRGPVVASPVAVGGHVLLGSTDGALYLLDTSGRVLLRQPLSPRGINASVAVDGPVLYAGSADGIHALRRVEAQA
jgi:outer membrane protein assembly factor BamB